MAAAAAVEEVEAAAVEGAEVAAAATAAVLEIQDPRTVRLQAEVPPGSHGHHLLRDHPVQEIELHRGRRIEHPPGPGIKSLPDPVLLLDPVTLTIPTTLTGLRTQVAHRIEHGQVPAVIVT